MVPALHGQAWIFDAAANDHVPAASQFLRGETVELSLLRHRLRKKHNYLVSQMGNANQMAFYFEVYMDTTLEKKGSKPVSVLMGGNTKLRNVVRFR